MYLDTRFDLINKDTSNSEIFLKYYCVFLDFCYISKYMQNINNKKEYVLSSFEIKKELRRPSQSMKTILNKQPVYINDFIKVFGFNCFAQVFFDENNNPEVMTYFPAEIHEGMKNGSIPFDRDEYSRICKKLADKARLIKYPTRTWKSV